MYPFQDGQSYARNRWYIAAFADEVSRKPVERTLLNLTVVLYRTEAGLPIAMYGLCPHRYYPLALGKLEGDDLVCGYHGFTFNPQGKCVRIPSQNTGAAFSQPTYRLEELGPLILIWLGEASSANPALIPPYEDFGLCQPGWTWSSKSYFHLHGRSQLLIDNLMDLTHLPFVHHHLPGGAAQLSNHKLEYEERDRSLRLRRIAKVSWNPLNDFLYGAEHKFDGQADRISLTDFYGPELIRTSAPIIATLDSGLPIPAGIGELDFIHGITPETERTTHYYGFLIRNFRINDSQLDIALTPYDWKVREQDGRP